MRCLKSVMLVLALGVLLVSPVGATTISVENGRSADASPLALIDDTRDSVNLGNGRVNPGESVTLTSLKTDNGNGNGNEFSLAQPPKIAESPEPASLLLLGTGAAVLAIRLRRRRRASK